MKSLVYYGPKDLRLEERPVPTPKKGEVLIKIRAVSVCGSDLGAYRLPEVSDRWAPPLVLGHEFAGEVAALGEGVENFKLGQAVTANPILYCGECYYCKRGLINLCTHRHSLGTSIGGEGQDGAMQEFATIRASALIPLLEGVSYVQGALLEPLAVSLVAARNGDFGDGERVLVIGAGPIGLMILNFLKAAGNKKVFISDLLPSRLEKALQIGADAAISGRSDVVKVISDLTDGIGVDRVIIAAGAPGVMEDSLKMVRSGGRIVLVALIHHTAEIDLMPIVARQISILGSYMFTNEMHDVMQMIVDKKLNVDGLVTSTYPLIDGKRVFDRLCGPSCDDVKVILTND
ncbi:MAG TPA: alcohol dehydrogenase catalytic domain-containing protein [Anaerolineaceae bacterium]|nr:alcohol dehydrogenase catalytic domain-containing protein [Anaerolineaceae bacterium]